jgi:N4-gp56 family major capsid protein
MPANLNSVAMADGIKVLYEKRLLWRALPRLVHGRWAKKASISGFGSMELRRYESMSAVTNALGEGSTPGETSAPTITSVTLDPSWYGAFIIMTDKLEAEMFDSMISETSGILGEQCGLSIDTLNRNVLVAGATTAYSGGVSAIGSLDAPAHNISYKDFVKQVFALMANNALPINGRWVVIAHPHSVNALFNDELFANLFVQEQGESAIRNGKIGTILNCDIYISSNAYESANAGAGSTTDVYGMMFLGADAWGSAGMSGLEAADVDNAGVEEYTMSGKPVNPVQIIVKGTDSGGVENALNQRGSIGWKATHDAEMLDADHAIMLLHTNEFSDD